MWILVVIILASPIHSNGGYSTSVVVSGFTTKQACINAANTIEIPKAQTGRVHQSHTIQCVARDV